MQIIQKSENLTKKQLYDMTTSPAVQKMSNAIGQILPVEGYALYEDVNKDGEVQSLLSILTENGDAYATNSSTFISDFMTCVNIAGEELHSIEVMQGKSKAGRPFIMCRWHD